MPICWKLTRHAAGLPVVLLLASLILTGLSGSAGANEVDAPIPAAVPELDPDSAMPLRAPAIDPRFESGVKAYRDADYNQALKLFEPLHRQAPENTGYTYYLAITEAQMGRFQVAKRLYNEIIILDPHGDTASLAKQGLQYLPSEASIDLPPRFNQQANVSTASAHPVAQTQAIAVPSNTLQAQNTPGASMLPAATGNALGMSPQDIMAFQMLMGQNGGMNGYNPMGAFMPGMMMGMPNGANGSAGMDPNIMSTMMMNQMIQNMNLGGEQGENR